MKKIKLDKGLITLVDDEDFEYLNQFKWCGQQDHDKNGNIDKFYAKRTSRVSDIGGAGKNILMHRVIMNCPKGLVVDHIDGDTLNNQKFNLRICTNKQNVQNTKRTKLSKSGYKGVYKQTKNGKRFRSSLRVDGRFVYLGTYDTPEQAARAYDVGAKFHFGEFANLNFPNE